jgi:uncharacterized protein
MSAFERYCRWLVGARWLVLGVVAVLTALVGSGITKLRAEYNIESSLPDEHPFIRIDKKIREEFGGRNTLIVAIIPRDGGEVWRPEILAVVKEFTLKGLQLPHIIAQNVVSLAAPSVRHAEESGGSISVDYLMRDVPQTPADMTELRKRLDGSPQLKGMLVTEDNRAALVILDFWTGPQASELSNQAFKLVDEFKDRGVDFFMAGEPMVSILDVEQSQAVATRIPITFAVIALILLISFRNLQGMMIPMLTGLLSTIWSLGLMGHTGIVIDSWNVATPILLIAVASGHSAQMLKRYAEEIVRLKDNREACVVSTVAVGPVMVAAGLTAALGFASLALFGVKSIGNFGLSCAYGIASCVFLELTFIPALRAILPAPKHLSPPDGMTDRLLSVLSRSILTNGGRSVVLGTCAALVLSFVTFPFIRTYGSTREYMPKSSVPRVHLEKIEEHFKGTISMTVLYEGEPASMKRLDVLSHMAALQDMLAKEPVVLRSASMADLVKELHKTFNGDDPEPYRLPDNQELVSQLLFLGESPAFERFTDRAQSKAVVIAYLKDDDAAVVGPLLDRTRDWAAAHPLPGNVQVLVAGGSGPTVVAIQEHTTHGKLINMAMVMAVIYLVASVLMRSPLVGFYVITPILVTIIEMVGIMGWTGMKLDMGTSSVLAMAAGIGADYGIYFLYRLREEHGRTHDDAAALDAALHASGRAVLFVAASIGAGFSVLGFSPYMGLQIFGRLMPLSMVLSCFASLTIMPVLVLRTRPKFIFGDAREAHGVAVGAH